MVIGGWWLVVGCWLLAFGFWLLAIGCWPLAPGGKYIDRRLRLIVSDRLLVIGGRYTYRKPKLFTPLFIVPLLMVCFVNAPVKAQDAAEELKKISEWYLARQSFESSFDYILYTDAGRKKQVEKQQGLYCRSGNKTYMKGLATETMSNETYSVTVNHQEKMIMASKAAEAQKQGTEVDQADLLKQYTNASDKLTYRKIDNSSSEISIQKENGPYAAVKVVYNHRQHILNELHLQFRNTDGINWTYGTKQPYLVIRYYGLKYDHKVSPSLFDEKRFITITAGTRKVKPAAAFARYQVFSTIN